MVTRLTLLKELAGTAPDPRMIVDDQSVPDIMKQMDEKAIECRGDYDKIYKYFEGGTIEEICERLYNWVLDNIAIFTESKKKQYVSCPYTILKRGTSDCKGYALFIAGVLDAMKRHGKKLTWCFRFASYSFFNAIPYHVFVVVNKNTDDIWIDPVLGEFNYHFGYWYKRDRRPKGARVGSLSFIGAAGDIAQPVPAGYPPDLPIPTLTSKGKLVLRLVNGKFFNPTNDQVEWIMAALQPLIIKYAPKPYNIHWSVKGWGSGKAHIVTTVNGLGQLFQNDDNFNDFLHYPEEPSGFDKFTIGLNDVVPGAMAAVFNYVLPGSGPLVYAAINSETSTAGEYNSPIALTPQETAAITAQQAEAAASQQSVFSRIPTWISNHKIESAALLAGALLLIAENE